MAFDESIRGYSLLDCTLRVPEFSLGTLTWLIVLVDYLDWRFWHSDFLCASLIYLFEIFDMVIILIDHLALLSIVILIFPWLFCSPHMHGFTGVYHLTRYVDSLTCILSWSSFEHDVHIAIHPDSCSFLCGHEWYILYFAWLYGAWLSSFCLIACCLSMWAAYISPYLQLSWFRSFLSSRFSLLQVWDLLCICSLTEPEIRSRV